MPWRVAGNVVLPSTNVYDSAAPGDGISLVGSSANAVQFGLIDSTSNSLNRLAPAVGGNSWMVGTRAGDIVLQAEQGRVSLGSGPDTSVLQVMVCNEGNSPSRHPGLVVNDTLSFSNPFTTTGELIT